MGQPSPLVDDLAKHLRQRILAGEFPAGARVTESGLAAEYGVARPTAKSSVDLLVAEGLLTRAPFAALRVPVLALADLPELLDLLDFVEGRALDRITRTDPDLRALRTAADDSLHHLLAAMVRASGSLRLELVHRRTTFELVLLGRQHPGVRTADADALRPTMRHVVDALVTQSADRAGHLLGELQHARRSGAGVSVRA